MWCAVLNKPWDTVTPRLVLIKGGLMHKVRSWLRTVGVTVLALTLVAGVSFGQSEDVTLTGRVTNENGVPLAGVNVLLEGMGIGTQTDNEGRYTFSVGASRALGQEATLVARLIGYTSKSVQVTLTKGQTITENFALSLNPLRLGEIIITGAGTETTRERLANVINTVDSSLIKKAVEPQNIVSALAGKAPNVDIRTQSGDPGSSSSIKIRGNPSLTGTNQPLFVVDGQPIDNSTTSTDQSPSSYPGSSGIVSQNRAADINPNDIESIEILKGAAAAAIYGARAANGVILITTKKGRTGAAQINFTSSTGWDRVIKTMPLQTKYAHGIDGETYVCPDVDCYAAAVTGAWGAPIPEGSPRYNQGKEIFKTGMTFDNYLSIAGGNERTTVFLSGGWTRQDGVMKGPNNMYTRTSVRVKADHRLHPLFTIGGNLNYIDTRGRYIQKGSNTSGLLLAALRSPPSFNNKEYLDPVTGLHRSYRFQRPGPASGTRTRGYDNPFFVLNSDGNRSELGRVIANVSSEWNPLEWLRVRHTLGSDYYGDWRQEALPISSSSFSLGRVIRNDMNNLQIDHNLVATAQRTFSDVLSGELTIGQNLNSERFRMNVLDGQILIAPRPFVLQNTVSVIPSEFRSNRTIESYFAQATLDAYNQLFVTLGIRNDGFSSFGSAKSRHNFPKASIAWNFSELMPQATDNGMFNFGKLRIAYGETGKEPGSPYSTLTAFSLESQLGSGWGDFISISQSGKGAVVTSSTLGNSDLKPERSKELEFGLDVGFLNNRADLGITVYNKKSRDVILSLPVSAAATGSLFQLANAAKIDNNGVELTFNLRPITNEHVAWDLGFNFGRNKNLVKDLAGTDFVSWFTEGFAGASGSATVGHAVGTIRGYDFVRCGRGLTVDGADVDAQCGAGKEGALYIGADGYPVLDPEERVIADPNPKYTLGFNTSVRINNRITFSTLLDMRRGLSVWNGTRGILLTFGTLDETLIRERTGLTMADWYRGVYPDFAGPGVNTVVFNSPEDWQDWFADNGGGFGDVGKQFVENANFVKWRELSVTYNVPPRFFNRIGAFSNVDLRLSARNLHTWTKYKGLDPETNIGGAEWLTQGIDYFGNPQTRSFVFSISLTR